MSLSVKSTRRELISPGDAQLVDRFEQRVPSWSTADVRTLLAKFGLRADHVERAVDELSPGEHTRTGLALLQVPHDRRMLQNVRLNRSWAVDNGRAVELQ
ncbi:hypothetical protein BI330_11675 [Mycobacterium sp. CBMA 623]|nr:hypothetical protein [Mycobacteroides sp. CBMA 326]